MFSRVFSTLFAFLFALGAEGQEVLNKQLLRADKHYINGEYPEAVKDYVAYLQEFPKDYYASKQAARCYDHLNDHYNAIDYWPLVAENSEVSDQDYLDYAKCLLANNREAEAKKIFKHLSRSKNPAAAAWGRSYLQPAFSYVDSASVRIFEVQSVNTGASEFAPVIFRDKLFLAQQLISGSMDYKAREQSPVHRLKIFVPKDSLNFISTLLFEKLQLMEIQGQVSFSKDGKWMYFSKKVSNKDMGLKSRTSFYNYQLYKLNLNTLNLPFPEVAAFEYNLAGFNSMHPSLSADDQRLYFSSNRKGSMGGMDLYFCRWTGTGWSFPENAGEAVNSNGNEVFPFCSQDSLIYFSSDQRPGLGGLDIFTSKLKPDGDGLEPAQNCGAPFNSRFDDYGVFILNGGKKGYFSSKRKSGTDEDLYYFCR